MWIESGLHVLAREVNMSEGQKLSIYIFFIWGRLVKNSLFEAIEHVY